MALEILFEEVKGLSEDSLLEVVRFAKFLKMESRLKDRATEDHTEKRKVRNAGMYKGQVWMADDFDAPLEAFKEYM